MTIETEQARRCAETLENNSRAIIQLCNDIEEMLSVAVQCMDSEGGRAAAARMNQNMENIKRSVPVEDDACKRLILALKQIAETSRTFGR